MMPQGDIVRVTVQRQCVTGPQAAQLHSQWESTAGTALRGPVKRR